MSYNRRVKFKNIKNFGLDFFGRLYRKSKFRIIRDSFQKKPEVHKTSIISNNLFLQKKNTKSFQLYEDNISIIEKSPKTRFKSIFFNKKNKNQIKIKKINNKLTLKFYSIYRRLLFNETIDSQVQYKTLLKYKISQKQKKKKKQKKKSFFLKWNRKEYRFFKKQKPFLTKLLYLKQFQWFYGKISRIRVKKLFLNFKKSKKIKVNELLFFLECKLDVFLFKCGFFASILQAKINIKLGKILVNNLVIKNPSFILNGNDQVALEKKERIKYYKQMISRIKAKNIFFFEPHYAEINYPTMTAIILKKRFKILNLKFPINFNLLAIKNIFKFF